MLANAFAAGIRIKVNHSDRADRGWSTYVNVWMNPSLPTTTAHVICVHNKFDRSLWYIFVCAVALELSGPKSFQIVLVNRSRKVCFVLSKMQVMFRIICFVFTLIIAIRCTEAAESSSGGEQRLSRVKRVLPFLQGSGNGVSAQLLFLYNLIFNFSTFHSAVHYGRCNPIGIRWTARISGIQFWSTLRTGRQQYIFGNQPKASSMYFFSLIISYIFVKPKSSQWQGKSSDGKTDDAVEDKSGLEAPATSKSRKSSGNLLSRKNVYRILESNLYRAGMNGTACLLKTICQTAESSMFENNGVFGNIFHIVFT